MKKKNLTILNAGIAFVMAFVISQFTSIIGITITEYIMSACGRSATQIDIFWSSSFGYLLQAIYMNVAFVGIFVWYYKSISKQNLLKHPNNNTYKYFSTCVIIGIATLFLLAGTLNYFQFFIEKIGLNISTPTIEINSFGNYLISLVSLAVIPAICEELLFRGVLVNCLKHKGPMFAVVFSSIMFAIFHFSPLQLIYPICFGLILGIVYLRTDNIIFPILLHFINNALSISIQYFSNSSGVFTHSTFMLIYAIVTLVIWIFIIRWLFKDFKKYNESTNNDNQIDNEQSIQTKSIETEQNNDLSKTKLNNRVFYGSIILMICIYMLLLSL